jgi:hypothetical protein
VDPATVLSVTSPADELLGWWRSQREQDPPPEHWPPQPGDIWQDRNGNRWASQVHDGYLVCLAFTADDSAEEIQKHHGPMRLVYRTEPTEPECPF